VKFKLTFIMREITMLELRRDARRALAAVRRGERLLLTYRGRPVARLEPIREERPEVPGSDALLRIEEFAVDGPAGRTTNAQIDRIVYGE
jgi:prevent-host-death family protein